jgi:shikimate kinase
MNNLTFIGMAGCGKSTLGRALSNKLGVAFTDTDALIED